MLEPASPRRNAFTALCVALLVLAVTVTILRLGSLPRAGTANTVPVVYRVGQVAAAVRIGASSSAPVLGLAPANGLIAQLPDAPAPDGWIHIQGRDWQGWVSPADVQGPFQRPTATGALAGFVGIDEL